MRYDIMLVVLCLVGVCGCQSQRFGIEAGTWMEADLNTMVYNQQTLKELTSVNPDGIDFQGGRGPDHLVCYTSSFGDRTKTNEWGNEAVIENGKVVSVGGNNSKIPENGLVISGNGSASRWISNNLRVGMQVELKGTVIQVITTENTFIYQAREVFRKVLDRQEERKVLRRSEIEEFEQDIQKKFNSLIKAKKEKNVEMAFQLSQQILSNAQKLYYSTFESRENEFRGAWIRLADKTPEELKATIQSMDEAGINAILPETIYNGYAIYPDAHPLLPQLPQFKGWDPMQIMVEECKKYGMKVIPWCEMFFVGKEGSPLVRQKPEWLGKFRHGEVAAVLEPGFHYFCPSRPDVSDFLLATLDTLLSRYDLEEVQLDYIRYSLSDPWDKGFCYCDYCRQQVKNGLHFDIMSISPENKNEWSKWNQYRVNNITNFVKQVNGLLKEKHPQVGLSVDVVPHPVQSLTKKFQDWEGWVDADLIDAVYIMSYALDNKIVDSDAGGLKEIVSGTKVAPIVGLGPYLGFQPEILLEQIEVARENGAAGVCLFSFNALSEAQIEALKNGPFREVN